MDAQSFLKRCQGLEFLIGLIDFPKNILEISCLHVGAPCPEDDAPLPKNNHGSWIPDDGNVLIILFYVHGS